MSKETILKKTVSAIVNHSLKSDANRTSCALIYQPTAPTKLETYKKTKKNDNQ